MPASNLPPGVTGGEPQIAGSPEEPEKPAELSKEDVLLEWRCGQSCPTHKKRCEMRARPFAGGEIVEISRHFCRHRVRGKGPTPDIGTEVCWWWV